MREKICVMRRWYGRKEKITIYLDAEEFDRIKKKFRLPQKLNLRIIRWWQDSKWLLTFLMVFAIKSINAILTIFSSKRFRGPSLVLGSYYYPDKRIKVFIDKIWLISDAKNLDDFIDKFCQTVAHEARHSKDIPDKAAMQIYLASKENARLFEKAADYFAIKHKDEFKKIFIFEVEK